MEIYLIHQYWEPTHFKALYDEEANNDYIIKSYIVLDNAAIIMKALRTLKYERSVIKAIKCFCRDAFNKIQIYKLSGKVLIVGLAPYDRLMIKYANVFQKNQSIYFTSWVDWSGENFPRGRINDKEKFEQCLKTVFDGVACVNRGGIAKYPDGLREVL